MATREILDVVIHRCDGCGAELRRGALRYSVTIDVRAAYDEIEIGLTELVRNHRDEILRLIERLKHRNPKEIEEQVYKNFAFDLCPACHQAYLRDPLRIGPQAGPPDEEIDIDGFLRSLGFGSTADGPDT